MAQFKSVNLQRKETANRQHGAALLVAIITLLLIALGGLNISARQILTQHEMLSLEFRRLERQRMTEQLFEEIVLLNQQSIETVEWTQLLHGSSALLNQLSASRELIDCPHNFNTTSLCSRIRVQHADTGFIRERVLVQPVSYCSQPYWYAPAARIGSHVDLGPEPKPPLLPPRQPDPVTPAPPKPPGTPGISPRSIPIGA